MTIRNIKGLSLPMRDMAQKFVKECERCGLDVLIYTTSRSLEEQAKIYRQSRKFSVIQRKHDQLLDRGFPELAEILMSVGAQNGRHVTNAAPGESLHNYGRAFDGVPMRGGKALWSVSSFKSEWDIYGACAEKVGLEWAGRWKNFREYAHCQQADFVKSNPLRSLSVDQVREMLGFE